MIRVNNLSHAFGSIQALKDLNFDVQKGQIFGVIGPDGAGKTTLIRILTTLLLPDAGNASVMGLDVVSDYKKIRNNIGYMPGRFSLYEDLTVEENVELFASIYGGSLQANYELIKDIYIQIEPFKDRLAGNLSGGMKQKLALSCAMIHAPGMIFLDEPTTGVDPVSRKEFWQMLHKLKERGITILVSTPYMDEARQCDRIALMYKGEFMDIETPDQIVENLAYPLYQVRSDKLLNTLEWLRKRNEVRQAYLSGEHIHFTLYAPIENDFRSKVEEEVGPMVKVDANIEDCFLDLMKRAEHV